MLKKLDIKGETVKIGEIISLAPVIWHNQVCWLVDFKWRLPIPPLTFSETKLVLSRASSDHSFWDGTIVNPAQINLEISRNERLRNELLATSSMHSPQPSPEPPSHPETPFHTPSMADPESQLHTPQSPLPGSGLSTSDLHDIPSHLAVDPLSIPQRDLLKSASIRTGNPRMERGVMAGPRDNLRSQREPTELELMLAKEWAEKLMAMPLAAHAPLPKNPQWHR